MSGSKQFRLLRERRFAPFFLAQACGAVNDNLLGNLLVLGAVYRGARYAPWDQRLLLSVVFILPFLVFSGLAGQLADRHDKARVLQWVKAAEIAIVALAGLGFAAHSPALLLVTLFLMGTHSSFFAPAKYALLPQVLKASELIGGNALLAAGTFIAILAGTLGAGLLSVRGSEAAAVGLLAVAVV